MKKHILLALFLPLFITTAAYCQTEFYKKGTIDVKMFGGKNAGSSYFNLEGKLRTEKKLPYDPDKKYIFNLTEYVYGARAEYAVNDNFAFSLSIPLKYSKLIKKADTTIVTVNNQVSPPDTSTESYRKTIGEYSLFQPEYFAIGAKYKLYSKKIQAAWLFEARIPPGFHRGIHDDPDYEFLSDGAFEAITGFSLNAKFQKSWLETAVLYNYRDEELVDQFIFHTQFGVSTVPGSKLLGFVNFIRSTGSFEDAVEFDPKETILQKNLFNLGFMFQLFFTENLYGEFSYKVNLLGKNAWNLGGFLIGAGARL